MLQPRPHKYSRNTSSLEGSAEKLSLLNKKQDKSRTHAINPQNIADVASFAMILPCDGAKALSTPICIPSDPRFANPQREYDAIVKARCDRGFELAWMLDNSARIKHQLYAC